RMRLWTPPPPRRGPPPGGPEGVPGPPPGGPDGFPGLPPGGPPPGGPGRVMIEFEPLLAEELTAGAERNLAISLVAAIALMGAAAFLYRQAARAAAAEARHERQRHLASLGEMSAVLAHEIRNPLAALKGHAQLLSEQLPDGGRERKRADRVVHEAGRLEALTRELLDFARSGQVQRAEVDPAALLGEAVEAVDPERIRVDAAGAPAAFPLDAVRMRQVLENLLRNAIQASPAEAEVEVTVAEVEGRLCLVVRDRGEGIPAGQEDRIFEAFHTTRVHGTGLGLAVARRIVELHGGWIRAESHPGGGAALRISIPRA
ncbi:MAG TPA: ATP-binding protein, partial [Candidatus Nanopelagicales bacterium]|nr:ATP-binding protein [Candidatus Nanopelagicales bacterium]